MPELHDLSKKADLMEVLNELVRMSPGAYALIAQRSLRFVDPLAQHFGVDISSVKSACENARRNSERAPWDTDSYSEISSDTRSAAAKTFEAAYQVASVFDKAFAGRLASVIGRDIRTIKNQPDSLGKVLELSEMPLTETEYWMEMLASGKVARIDWSSLKEISEGTRPLRVFLCHSSNDKPRVRDLYQRLLAENMDAWLDEEKLLPGQDWNLEISTAVRTTDVVIICLSHGSINKAGYVQKEIKHALDVADEQPEGAIFLIPLKLEECDVPHRLQHLHWVNYFEEGGYRRLMSALRFRAAHLT